MKRYKAFELGDILDDYTYYQDADEEDLPYFNLGFLVDGEPVIKLINEYYYNEGKIEQCTKVTLKGSKVYTVHKDEEGEYILKNNVRHRPINPKIRQRELEKFRMFAQKVKEIGKEADSVYYSALSIRVNYSDIINNDEKWQTDILEDIISKMSDVNYKLEALIGWADTDERMKEGEQDEVE